MTTQNEAALQKTVLIERKGKIAYIILNRPEKLNAFNADLFADLDRALDELEKDDSVSVLIIKGNGRAFSVGYDVAKYKTPTVIQDKENLEGYTRRWIRIWEYPKPIIAQVHGYALAGGTQLLASCDIVITDEDTQFGFPSLPLGGGFVGLYWHWHVGPQRTKMLDLTAGSRITGREAEQYGIAAKCVPAGELEEATLEVARGIAKTPLDILKLKKQAHNRIMELQGFRTGVMYGPEQDAIIHTADGIKLVHEKIAELGLKGAIEWFHSQEV
ncbi:enoyl-CoA hydratase-related protein [Lysinibacillus endophyticus]|uniref:enoyl-CoA hydratase-related protein n=1 Tax=Ureibacillus endophyticus TaxID=1978490 RepID=UPI0020A07C42|nr:enoyl-CoA hydratase-related protein [Lysinibacillus endophyticus]MCP1146687.1 enoyl-CoA hydratase-related protein [Lysinibacillus endophyticus]